MMCRASAGPAETSNRAGAKTGKEPMQQRAVGSDVGRQSAELPLRKGRPVDLTKGCRLSLGGHLVE
jgi:hypothetical protein